MSKATEAPVDIYVRVSRVGGREHMISPEEQERDARAFAERRGLRVAEVFTDLDRSGGTLERPELQEALARVRAGTSGGIVVAYLSRLTRETSQGLALLEDIRAAGGEVYAPNLSDHTTADGRMLNTIQLAIDAGMRERAKEQIARARENAVANGIPVTNRDAVGYRRNSERRYEPDPDVAPVIREVFERRAAGAGPAELAELLESHGVRTSQGSRTWSKPAVQSLIRSRTYLGELRSGPYVNPTSHEPIVDEPTWLAAQSPNPAPRRARKGGYLLAGVLRCQACGYSMQGTVSSRGKRIYRCVRRHAGGICPAPARIEAAVAEEAVVGQLFERASLIFEKKAATVDTAPLQEAFDAADRRLQQALTPAAQDALGETWATVVKERRLEREAAAAALGEARATADAGDVEQRVELMRHWQDEVGMESLAGGGTEAVYFLDPELKRRLIAEAFPAISVSRDKALDYGPNVSGLSRRGYRREPGLNPL
jgi:DNA invertase Pin-like site-specific DNA recombinase